MRDNRIRIVFVLAGWAALAPSTRAQAQVPESRGAVQEAPGLAVLIERLGDDDYLIREEATRAIIAAGPEHADRLRARLADEPDAEIRYRLRYILDNIVPPVRAVLLVRASDDLALEPGTLITHVNTRRVRDVVELRRRLADLPAGAQLRVTGPAGPHEVGPVTNGQLVELCDYHAPRGETVASALRLYAHGLVEQAYETLRGLGEPIPRNELSAPLHARIAYVAGDAATARNLLEDLAYSTDRAMLGRDWGTPSAFDLMAPGKAPFHLEWWLFTTGGFSTDFDPDLRVQRVLVPANRFVDALHGAASLWWTRYRHALGDRESTRIAGNMLAVSGWMLSDLELLSECLRLVEPRSAILRRSSSQVRKWIRVRTDAWLPFFQGDARGALDSLYEDARDVLQRPRRELMLIRNPRVAAAVAFFLYQFPQDPRVQEMLRIVNHPGQIGLIEYVDWMIYSASERNHARLREDLAAILPTLSDADAAPLARAVALLEYVREQPDDEVYAAARHRLDLSPEPQMRRIWLALVDALRHLSSDRVEAARDALAKFADEPPAKALWHTIQFRLDPPPGAADRPILRAARLAVPVGNQPGVWLILARDRRLMRYDAAGGTLEALDRPTPTWFPGPQTWPWIGREESTGRVWVYGRRRVLELENDEQPLRLNIRTADIPAFDRYAGPFFSTLAEVTAAVPLAEGERGEYRTGEVRAHAEYTTDPDLPEVGMVQAIPNRPEVFQIALRGGPHLLVDTTTRQTWTSHWIAQQLGLDAPPTFFARGLPGREQDGSRTVFLMSDQGLLRFDLATARLERLALPGDEPFPALVPESAPYERRDPRWVYCARLPQDGGGVYRVRVADGAAEAVDMINEALPAGYYRVRSRAALRQEIDETFARSGIPPLEEFVSGAVDTVSKWNRERKP